MGGSLDLGRAGRVLLCMTLFGMFGAGARAAIHQPRTVLQMGPSRVAPAVSPDGSRIAMMGGSAQVIIFDAYGRLQFVDPASAPFALTFSPDSKSLAIGSSGGAKLIASTARTQLAYFPVKYPGVDVAFSPDGTTLYISSTATSETTRFSIDARKMIGRPQPVGQHVAFSPDHKTLVAWGQLPTVYLCAPDLTIRARLEGQQKPPGAYMFVNTVAFSPDSKTLATASPDGTVYLWNVDAGTLRAKLIGHGGGVNAIAFSPDGRTLVSASEDTTLKIWNVATGMPAGTLQGHAGPVYAVVYAADGRMIASGSGDGTARLWDPDTLRERSCMLGVDGPVGHVLFIRGGKGLFAAGRTATRVCSTFLLEIVPDRPPSSNLLDRRPDPRPGRPVYGLRLARRVLGQRLGRPASRRQRAPLGPRGRSAHSPSLSRGPLSSPKSQVPPPNPSPCWKKPGKI